MSRQDLDAKETLCASDSRDSQMAIYIVDSFESAESQEVLRKDFVWLIDTSG